MRDSNVETRGARCLVPAWFGLEDLGVRRAHAHVLKEAMKDEEGVPCTGSGGDGGVVEELHGMNVARAHEVVRLMLGEMPHEYFLVLVDLLTARMSDACAEEKKKLGALRAQHMVTERCNEKLRRDVAESKETYTVLTAAQASFVAQLADRRAELDAAKTRCEKLNAELERARVQHAAAAASASETDDAIRSAQKKNERAEMILRMEERKARAGEHAVRSARMLRDVLGAGRQFYCRDRDRDCDHMANEARKEEEEEARLRRI